MHQLVTRDLRKALVEKRLKRGGYHDKVTADSPTAAPFGQDAVKVLRCFVGIVDHTKGRRIRPLPRGSEAVDAVVFGVHDCLVHVGRDDTFEVQNVGRDRYGEE